jgi:hypothetical protein
METISVARFKATCVAFLEQVEQTVQSIRVTRRGKPVAQISSVGKRRIMGCMEGTAKIVGDLEPPAVVASDWEAPH